MAKGKTHRTNTNSTPSHRTKKAVKRLQMTLRSQEAFNLRLQGLSYQDIAARLGMSSHGNVYTDIQTHIVAERSASADRAHQRLEQDARYRALLQVWWPRALAPKPNISALNGVMAILKRLDEIWGLDLGRQLERDGISDALLAVLHEMQARPLGSGTPEPVQPALPDPSTLDAIWHDMSHAGEVDPESEELSTGDLDEKNGDGSGPAVSDRAS